MSIEPVEIPAVAADGHAYQLIARIPALPTASLLWLPALGVAARHYLPLADALAARGVAVFLHEMRGNGSSTLRAGRTLGVLVVQNADKRVYREEEAEALETVAILPPGRRAANFGFDVTPARLVTGLITERGVCSASRAGLLSLYPEAGA